MLYLDKLRLKQQASQHGWSIAELAKQAGVSRQSLYNMLGRNPVFNTSFAKILQVLRVPYQAITTEASVADALLADAPETIRKIVLTLIDFCRAHNAALLLFGSRVRGKSGPRVDWDFAIWFHGTSPDRAFRSRKRIAHDAAFPYRLDLIHLNQAPAWFRNTVDQSHIVLYGTYP